MERPILKGRFGITDNFDFVRDLMNVQDSGNIIINLDEDTKFVGNNVITGVILLPPPEAVMAESDGDEVAYNFILQDYYMSPQVQLYVTGILRNLYLGLNIILYSPDVHSKESVTVPKILQLFWEKFGIGIGIIGENECLYNYTFSPMWLNMLYDNRVIDPYEFLLNYPLDAKIQDLEIDMLINDLRPIEQNLNDKIKNIYQFRDKLHRRPDLKRVFFKI